jgi:MoxR-like ATPase
MMTAIAEPPTAVGAPAPTPVDLPTAVATINTASDETKDIVVESDSMVDAIVLATASRTHTYIYGGGGAGKTFGVEEWSRHLDYRFFYTQCRTDMKREELFGPLSMKALQNDRYVHVTDGFLPWAQVAVLDEIADAKAFLRQLLNILNERWFVNGGVRMNVDLKAVFSMTNFWIEDVALAALFDRFAQRLEQEPVKTSAGFKKVIRGQLDRSAGATVTRTIVTADMWSIVHEAVDHCTVGSDIVDELDKLRKTAQGEKLVMSPRRWGEGMKLAKASAVLAGRDHVLLDDLRVFTRVLPNHPDDFKTARDLTKNFRDPFTAVVEQARDALLEITNDLTPVRDAVAAGTAADTSVLTATNFKLQQLDERIAKAKADNPSRATSQLDKLTTEAGEVREFIVAQVMGGMRR